MKTIMSSKEIGVLNLKIEIAQEMESVYDKLFAYRMQTLSCDHRELRGLSSDLSEVLEQIEAIQNQYFIPVNPRSL